jgi:hypothetical protein
MNVLDDLVPIIDNGGQRSHIKRRCNSWLHFFPERRSNLDRRKVDDRRKIQNRHRSEGPERRKILKDDQ